MQRLNYFLIYAECIINNIYITLNKLYIPCIEISFHLQKYNDSHCYDLIQ